MYKKLAASCAEATASRSAKEVMFHRRSFVRWDKNNLSKILWLLASKRTGVVPATYLLVVLRFQLHTYGRRAFTVADATI